MSADVFSVSPFLAFTIGILVFFVGVRVNASVGVLRSYNIPEAVTGGIIAAVCSYGVFVLSGVAIEYEQGARDLLIVYFFTAIGLNARLSDLVSGGRPLTILLTLTLGYIVVQNVIGVGTAVAIGQPNAVGVLAGSASLIGGHATAIGWAPEIAENHDVPNALEIGVASATLGLVVASLLGGPIAKFIIARDGITGPPPDGHMVGIPHETRDTEQINHISLMRVILVLHIAIITGFLANGIVADLGLLLPNFVPCLLVAIILSNTVPRLFPTMRWPARTRALALVSDFSLSIFIAMSLMSMQLWDFADLAGPLLIILGAQVVAVVLFILLVLYPLMGRDYLATVLSAGFAGFALGATPTAVANMTAVTKTHGPAPTAFIILPLVGAFFVDLTNAVVIRAFLAL